MTTSTASSADSLSSTARSRPPACRPRAARASRNKHKAPKRGSSSSRELYSASMMLLIALIARRRERRPPLAPIALLLAMMQ